MKRTVERVVPLLPAVAAVGVSVCASSLVFTNPPPPVGAGPLVTPAVRHVGRVLAQPVLLTPPSPRRPAAASRPSGVRGLTARARQALATKPSPEARLPVNASPSPPPPAPTPTSPPPAPPAVASPPPPAPAPTVQTSTVQAATPQAGSKPGWGRGDRNHDHAGPPGQASKGKDGKSAPAPPPPPPSPPPSSPQPPPPVPAADTHGNDRKGDKKSPGK
jgi:hypothetical protein